MADTTSLVRVFREPLLLRMRDRIVHWSQHLTQFAMPDQLHHGFAKRPVFVAHQAEDGRQRRLRELVLAETVSIRGPVAPIRTWNEFSTRCEFCMIYAVDLWAGQVDDIRNP